MYCAPKSKIKIRCCSDEDVMIVFGSRRAMREKTNSLPGPGLVCHGCVSRGGRARLTQPWHTGSEVSSSGLSFGRFQGASQLGGPQGGGLDGVHQGGPHAAAL